MTCLYEALGVNKDATKEEIKSAYRKKASKHHPDKDGGDKAAFQAISVAYDTLSDEAKRERYDQTGSFGPEKSVEDHANELLAQIYMTMLERNNLKQRDYVDLIKREVKLKIRSLNEEASVISRDIKRLDLLRKDIKTESFIFSSSIDQAVNQAQGKLDHNDEILNTCQMIIEILDGCEYIGPKEKEWSDSCGVAVAFTGS